MKRLVFFAVFSLTAFVIVSLFSCTAQTPKANLKTDIDSLSYAYGVSATQGLDDYLLQMEFEGPLRDEFFKGFYEGMKVDKKDKKASARLEGYMIGARVSNDFFVGINGNLFGADTTQSLNKLQYLAGFIAAVQNKDLLIDREEVDMFVQMKSSALQAKANEQLIAVNQAFLDENRNKEGVISLPSGLQYKVIEEGNGPKPTAASVVKANYKGMLIDGSVFNEGEGVEFSLEDVIPGWTEGLQLMPVGSKYTLYLPYDLAYGEMGSPPQIQPYATLIFEVGLLEIVE